MILLNEDKIATLIEYCQRIQNVAPSDSPQYEVAELALQVLLNEDNNIIPDGWQLVPKEPDNEMYQIVPAMAHMNINRDEYDVSRINQRNAKWIYQSMLNKSPRCNVIKIQKIQHLNETKEVSFLKLNK